MATQNSLPPFFSPFSPPSQPTAVFTKFPGIKYEGNTVFEDRERKVGIKVTDIKYLLSPAVSVRSIDVQCTNTDVHCCICAVESKSMHKEKDLPIEYPLH